MLDSLAVNIFANHNVDLTGFAKDAHFTQVGLDVSAYLGKLFEFTVGYKGIWDLVDTSYDEIVAGLVYRFAGNPFNI